LGTKKKTREEKGEMMVGATGGKVQKKNCSLGRVAGTVWVRRGQSDLTRMRRGAKGMGGPRRMKRGGFF